MSAEDAKTRWLETLGRRFGWRADNIYRGPSPENSSPLYEHLSREISTDKAILELLVDADPHTQVANLLFGAVQFLLFRNPVKALVDHYASLVETPLPPQEGYVHFREFCLKYAAEIKELVTYKRVQTNEVGRCTAFVPAFVFARSRTGSSPLNLIELGASAGLNLLWDKYYYNYSTGQTAGDPSSAVHLSCEVRSSEPLPDLATLPTINSRIGVDIHPIDLHDDAKVQWARALIWPEHRDRRELFDLAVDSARDDPPTVLNGDMIDVLPELLDEADPDATVFVLHSYTLNQCAEETREEVDRILRGKSFHLNLHRISLEWFAGQEKPHLELSTYDSGREERILLRYCESHGRWINWQVNGVRQYGAT